VVAKFGINMLLNYENVGLLISLMILLSVLLIVTNILIYTKLLKCFLIVIPRTFKNKNIRNSKKRRFLMSTVSAKGVNIGGRPISWMIIVPVVLTLIIIGFLVFKR